MAGPAGAVRPVEKGVHPIPAMEPARCLEAHIDWHIYKERHLAEILFLKFKARCRFSTRYEKRATYFLLLLFLLPSSFGLLEFEDML